MLPEDELRLRMLPPSESCGGEKPDVFAPELLAEPPVWLAEPTVPRV